MRLPPLIQMLDCLAWPGYASGGERTHRFSDADRRMSRRVQHALVIKREQLPRGRDALQLVLAAVDKAKFRGTE